MWAVLALAAGAGVGMCAGRHMGRSAYAREINATIESARNDAERIRSEAKADGEKLDSNPSDCSKKQSATPALSAPMPTESSKKRSKNATRPIAFKPKLNSHDNASKPRQKTSTTQNSKKPNSKSKRRPSSVKTNSTKKKNDDSKASSKPKLDSSKKKNYSTNDLKCSMHAKQNSKTSKLTLKKPQNRPKSA